MPPIPPALACSDLQVGSYYYNPATSTSVDAVWIGPEDDTLLRLRISAPDTCPPSANGGQTIGSGVMLTYTGGSTLGGARLLDGQGNPLADIGVDWAVAQVESCLEDASYGYFYCTGNTALDGQLPRLTSLIEIPCPEDR